MEVSAVVRTQDSARTLAETVAALRAQTVPVEVVVVDAGSTDGTLELAQRLADTVVRLTPGTFTYGRALNAGAAAASGEVHAPVSSHCVLPHRDWAAVAVGHVAAGALATWGSRTGADGSPLAGPVPVDHAHLRRHWAWGYTNHASAYAARAWAEHPFDEELVAVEDREWSWRVTAGGGHLVVDPRLTVPIGHRRGAGVRAYSRRLVRETRAFRHLGVLPPYSLTDAARDWWAQQPVDPLVSSDTARGRTRAVEAAARWWGGR